MKGLSSKLLNFCRRHWGLSAVLLFALVFFSPVYLKNKIPLPADALVGAHVPWTEVMWNGYPAGVPIKNLEITDAISQFYPWRKLVGEFWREGKVPLWNSYMFSGTPFLATLHSGALYPLNIVYLFFNDITSWSIFVFLQVILAVVFMYIFLRDLGIKEGGSYLGSISFAFSGYMLGWLEFATGGHAGLWLPLILLMERKLVKTRQRVWVVLIAVVFFFVYTAGDFQVPLYVTGLYMVYGLFLIRRFSIRKIMIVMGALFLGILLSLPQILPSEELFLSSIRVNDNYIQNFSYGLMPWVKTVNFMWPDFFGNPATGNYWGAFDYHEHIVYPGVVSLVFALFTILSKKSGVEKFFLGVLIFSLVLLFPNPLAYIPFKLSVPGLGTSAASRIIFLIGFSLAVLGAFGFERYKKDRLLLRIVVVLLTITLLVGVGLFILVGSGELNFVVALRNMIIPTGVLIGILYLIFIARKNIRVGLYLLLILASGDLLRHAWKNTVFSDREHVFADTPVTEFLKNQDKPFRIAGGIATNLFMPYGLSSAEGYDPIYPTANSEWFSIVNNGDLSAPSGRFGLINRFDSPLIDDANIKYVVDYKKNAQGSFSERGSYYEGVSLPKFKEVFVDGRVVVFENLEVKPRVWSEKEIEVSSFKESYNELSFKISLEEEADVVVSQSYYPGWVAYIDGKETSIEKSDLFQKIKVPRGRYRVNFVYRPISFSLGVAISALTLAFMGLYLVKK